MYKKAWCTSRLVVLLNKPIAVLMFLLPSPSSLLKPLWPSPGFQKGKGSKVDHERHSEGQWKEKLTMEGQGHGQGLWRQRGTEKHERREHYGPIFQFGTHGQWWIFLWISLWHLVGKKECSASFLTTWHTFSGTHPAEMLSPGWRSCELLQQESVL